MQGSKNYSHPGSTLYTFFLLACFLLFSQYTAKFYPIYFLSFFLSFFFPSRPSFVSPVFPSLFFNFSSFPSSSMGNVSTFSYLTCNAATTLPRFRVLFICTQSTFGPLTGLWQILNSCLTGSCFPNLFLPEAASDAGFTNIVSLS